MSAYYTNFQNIINHLDLDDHAKIMFFRNGIREKVKELLIGRDKIPTTFVDFVQLCIRLDNDIRAFEIERTYKNRTNPNHRPPFRKPFNPSPRPQPFNNQPREKLSTAYTGGPGAHFDAGPMELDAGFTHRVTSEEKERRKQKNLCLRCGKSGHYARNCYNTGRWQSNGNRDYKGKQPDRRYNQPSRSNAAANETRPREEETRPREGTQKGIPTARWSQNASANISANAATADTAAATNDAAPEPETGYDSNPESPMYTPEEGSDTEDTPDSDTDEIDLFSKSGPSPDLEMDQKNYPRENYKASPTDPFMLCSGISTSTAAAMETYLNVTLQQSLEPLEPASSAKRRPLRKYAQIGYTP